MEKTVRSSLRLIDEKVGAGTWTPFEGERQKKKLDFKL